MFRVCVVAIALFVLAGCSTTQQVTLTKGGSIKPIASVAQVADDGNSSQMDINMTSALQKQGLTIKSPLPKGTRTSLDVDALVSYVDVWRWDIVMYLKNLTVRLHDAQTGDLLALAEWADSPLHGFRDSKAVMEGLVTELFAKLKAAKETK